MTPEETHLDQNAAWRGEKTPPTNRLEPACSGQFIAAAVLPRSPSAIARK